MQLTEHFTLSEFTLSQTATRKGINNEPTPEAIENLKALCLHILEPLREAANAPIRISSGYRSLALNRTIGSKDDSQHIKGQAADFTVSGLSVAQIIELIQKLDLPFDQLLDEYSAWAHCSYSPRHRRQVLKIR
jgi:uncharacterized protein YcbK (DUF882 family)